MSLYGTAVAKQQNKQALSVAFSGGGNLIDLLELLRDSKVLVHKNVNRASSAKVWTWHIAIDTSAICPTVNKRFEVRHSPLI